MDIRIGVTDTPREISVQLPDDVDRDGLKQQIEAAMTGASTTLWITDSKGRETAVAASRLAYVEIGPDGGTPIGFS